MDPNLLINLDDINTQLSSTENMIKKAENKIKDLKDTLYKRENPDLLKEENEDLKLTHQLSVEDIKIYSEKALKLNEEFKKNVLILSKLREENEKLKKNKNINKQQSKENKNMILNFKDLYKSIGLKRIKELKNDNIKIDNNDYQKNNKENKNNENAEKINKKKEEYEKVLYELKNKANQINLIMKKQNEKINGHRKYLNEVQISFNKFRERLNISLNNILINKNDPRLNELMTFSFILFFVFAFFMYLFGDFT